MNARRQITDDERRARLGTRHRLATTTCASDVRDVADSLVALHSTDPASVFLSANARMRDGTVAHVEKALYDDRSLVRILGMRRTLFVVPVALVPIVHACAAIAATQRRRYAGLIEQGGIADDGSVAGSRVTPRWRRCSGGARRSALSCPPTFPNSVPRSASARARSGREPPR